jgi:inositol phosphorylceramide mannosyltransferase catalytic subunit
MRIPRNIYQTIRHEEDITEELKENFARIRELNGNWTHKVFTTAEQLEYLEANLSPEDFCEIERINPKYGVVFADVFRYLLMYNEGGVYLDSKSTATRPLDQVLSPDTSFVISQWHNKVGSRYQWAGIYPELDHVPGGEFQQWAIIAAPKHPFLKAVVKQTLYNIRTYTPDSFGVSKIGVLRLTGPICFTKTVWPLLDHHDWNAKDLLELGFRYSIFEDLSKDQLHEQTPGHYTKLNEPVVMRDVYVERRRDGVVTLAELLARELRENIDLVLKLAVISFVSTITFVMALSAILIWHLV